MEISAHLVGQRVQNEARPDWGTGRVVSVAPGATPEARRVTIDFPVVGRKALLVPPARLKPPADEPVRQTGWLESLAGAGVDERLRQLPQDVLHVLGTPAQRLAALLPWYEFDASRVGVWARKLVGAADPLALWSRDELEVAFGAFCRERDAQCRMLAALFKQQEGEEALRHWLAGLETGKRERVLAALRAPI